MKKMLLLALLAASSGLLGIPKPTPRLERSLSTRSLLSLLQRAPNLAVFDAIVEQLADRQDIVVALNTEAPSAVPQRRPQPVIIVQTFADDDDSATPSTSYQPVDWANRAAILEEMREYSRSVTAALDEEAEANTSSKIATKDTLPRSFELN